MNALEKPYAVAISPDGASVYTAAEGPGAVASFARNTATGALSYESCIGNESKTGCTATSPADALNDADSLLVSPDGNDLYAGSGLTLSTFARANGSTPSCTGGCPGPPGEPVKGPPPGAGAQTIGAVLDNQKITLLVPPVLPCTAATGKLSVSLDSSAITGSRATKLTLGSAAIFLDKGVRHVHRTTVHAHGRRTSRTVVSYGPNATLRHLPAKPALSLSALKAGRHTLTVKLSYTERLRRHGHTRTVTVTKTLSAQFTVC